MRAGIDRIGARAVGSADRIGHLVGIGVDRRLGDGHGELVAVAVQDAAALRGQGDGLLPFGAAGGQVVGRVDTLDDHQLDADGGECDGDQDEQHKATGSGRMSRALAGGDPGPGSAVARAGSQARRDAPLEVPLAPGMVRRPRAGGRRVMDFPPAAP